jgi:hypothetical protein
VDCLLLLLLLLIAKHHQLVEHFRTVVKERLHLAVNLEDQLPPMESLLSTTRLIILQQQGIDILLIIIIPLELQGPMLPLSMT